MKLSRACEGQQLELRRQRVKHAIQRGGGHRSQSGYVRWEAAQAQHPDVGICDACTKLNPPKKVSIQEKARFSPKNCNPTKKMHAILSHLPTVSGVPRRRLGLRSRRNSPNSKTSEIRMMVRELYPAGTLAGGIFEIYFVPKQVRARPGPTRILVPVPSPSPWRTRTRSRSL